MKIEITKISDTHFIVNDKNIHQTMDGEWICLSELTPMESKMFYQAIKLDPK